LAVAIHLNLFGSQSEARAKMHIVSKILPTTMSKKLDRQKPLIISGKKAKKALSIGLDRYVESIGHKTSLSEYAGSIDFSDDEFDAMLQELKEDK
jgi:hypothetical protein